MLILPSHCCSFHQEVLAPSHASLIVKRHLLPGEVESGRHALVTDLREGAPAEHREPAAAGGRTGDHPVVVGRLRLRRDDLAVDDSEGLRIVPVEVLSGSDAFPHVFLLVDEHPVLDVLCGCHLGVELPEDPGPGVVFEIVGVCVGGGVHCWQSNLSQTYWSQATLQEATKPFLFSLPVMSCTLISPNACSRKSTTLALVLRWERSTMTHWLLCVPLLYLLKQLIHSCPSLARFEATAALSQQGTLLGFSSLKLSLLQFSREVSTIFKPDESTQKSSLELKSPGLPLKERVSDPTQGFLVGKWQLLKILSMQAQQFIVECATNRSSFSLRTYTLQLLSPAPDSPAPKAGSNSLKSPTLVRQQNWLNPKQRSNRDSSCNLCRQPRQAYLHCSRQARTVCQQRSLGKVSAICSMNSIWERRWPWRAGFTVAALILSLLRLTQAAWISRQVVYPSKNPAPLCCSSRPRCALAQTWMQFVPCSFSLCQQQTCASSSCEASKLTLKSALTEKRVPDSETDRRRKRASLVIMPYGDIQQNGIFPLCRNRTSFHYPGTHLSHHLLPT